MTRLSRRRFIQQVSALGVSGAATPLALGLSGIGAAAAASASDYKAIVCVFLYGGNDPYNTIVPYDATGYRKYAAARTDIALERNSLAATALTARTPLPDGQQFALAPSLSVLKPYFDSGKLAVQLNVGPLIVPTTKAQYIAASVPLPPKLFSHNDQQAYWQALAPEGAASGWGGRMADLLASGNGSSIFTNVSAGDNALLLSGRKVISYRVGPEGSTPIDLLQRDIYGSTACTDLLRELITESQSHLFADHHAQTVARSIRADAQLRKALSGVEIRGDFGNPLVTQLKVVARMIAARDAIGAKRQIFFVSLNGFDNHDGLLGRHRELLAELGSALNVFQTAVDRLGVGNNVTTFTASEFGRTLNSNGNGSDHGWGSHHLVLGGAVKGGRYYGRHPDIAVAGPGFVDHGRLLPTTSVEQFAATLGAWFGASASELNEILPNLAAFSDRNLGFV